MMRRAIHTCAASFKQPAQLQTIATQNCTIATQKNMLAAERNLQTVSNRSVARQLHTSHGQLP